MEYRTKNMVWVCYHWRWIRSGFRSVEGDALAVAGKDLLRSLFAWDSTGHWAKLFEVRSGWVMSPRSHQKWWFVKVTMAKMARVFQSVEFLWFSQIIRNDKRSPKNSPDIAKLTVFDWSRSMFGRFWQVVFRNSYFRVLYASTYIYILYKYCVQVWQICPIPKQPQLAQWHQCTIGMGIQVAEHGATRSTSGATRHIEKYWEI